MALLALIGVLRGFPAAAYRRTPHCKPLCGLDQDKNCSFMDGHLIGSITFLDGHCVVFVFIAFSLEPLAQTDYPYYIVNKLSFL